jgi:hypothetical protein
MAMGLHLNIMADVENTPLLGIAFFFNESPSTHLRRHPVVNACPLRSGPSMLS